MEKPNETEKYQTKSPQVLSTSYHDNYNVEHAIIAICMIFYYQNPKKLSKSEINGSKEQILLRAFVCESKLPLIEKLAVSIS